MNWLVAIRAFNSVVREGSFSGAAQEISLSRSAISRYVNDLEEELGVRLINRTTRHLHVTEAGQHYFEKTSALLSELDSLNSGMADSGSNPRGTLRVTAPVIFGEAQILPIVGIFLEQNPGMNVVLELTNDFVDIVQDGYDIAIRVTASMHDSSLISRRIATMRYIPCASPAYCETHGTPTAPHDLKEHNCIVSTTGSHGPVWEFVSEAGKRFSVPIKGRIALSAGGPHLEAARKGLGIALLPDYLASGPAASGDLVELLPEYNHESYPVFVVFPHRRLMEAKIRSFLDLLVDRL